MKIAYIATGAANMYCGSCMRDNTLVAAMKKAGHDVVMVPLYTPLRVDEENVSEKRVFYGGIEAYFLQKYPNPSIWRDLLLKMAGSQAVLRLLPKFDIGSAVDPAQNAELTLSMLRGEAGNQSPLLEEMIDWLAASLKPDMVHITNTLISGPAKAIKEALNVPVVCGLHGEDVFIDGLPDHYRQQAIAQIHANCAHIDHFISISHYYADYFGELVGIEKEKITVVPPGIALEDYKNLPVSRSENGTQTIGYLARLSQEKGFHILADAYIQLVKSGEFPGLKLKVAGYLSKAYRPYVDGVRKKLERAGVMANVEIIGTVDRQQKLDFLRSIDLFSLPTVYRDPKGLPVLEALAAGVPVVQPDHGAFPYLVEATGGGLLHEPENADDLAEKLALLLKDDDLRPRLERNGRNKVHSYFSAERMADETMQIYRQVVASHS